MAKVKETGAGTNVIYTRKKVDVLDVINICFVVSGFVIAHP